MIAKPACLLALSAFFLTFAHACVITGNTTLTERDWRDYAPALCTDKNYHCLTVEIRDHFFIGFKHLYCDISRQEDEQAPEPRWRTYFFDGVCEGQIAMKCFSDQHIRTRGLTSFSFGRKANHSSEFSTTDPNVKGQTSDLQVVTLTPGKEVQRSKTPWVDFQLACRFDK
ncbi:hypothetical protein BDZ90DRAFT_234530 [Jaminaea rosea]|uniref:DUF1036 domain-containing protein n=1 Tax=Jaminaea rosea TaxID=1569628 RepID=A0A316UI24_9BASI|nr:hypothetical protein BDZ90DRAFT_234530 [Jaminaea rosea]PWN24922.1 hypothetical protein BDZ90DRAFT_234530 [Jaminaea rosea]